MPNEDTIYMHVFLTQESIYEDITAISETGHFISYSGFCVLLKHILLMFTFLRLPALTSVIPIVSWSHYSKQILTEGNYLCNELNIYNSFNVTKKTTMLVMQKPKPLQH
ncbi:hypothetical protein QOT17_002616 [Balamuthia mandrillaris]